MNNTYPKLVVFDLDYTLWPFWIDTHISPPLRVSSQKIVDRSGTELAFYNDVPRILTFLRECNVRIGIASRTSAPKLARQALDLLRIDGKAIECFDAQAIEIYPGSKIKHFQRIHANTGIAYEDMVFFDDERRNIEVSELGVSFVLVPDGMNQSVFKRGLNDWRKKRHVSIEQP